MALIYDSKTDTVRQALDMLPDQDEDWRDRGGRGSYDNTGGISDTAQAQAARKIREGNRGFFELLSAYTILNLLSRLLGRRSFDDWFQEPYTP